MSSVSGVSSGYTDYGNIASGTAISSAADGAAELSIIEEDTAELTGLNQGTENISDAQNLLNITDSALSGISDYLQRMYELAIQASNGTYSAEDKQSIQDEIEQLKQGITDLVSSTDYNGLNLLDGSTSDVEIVTDSDGNSTTVSAANSTLEALGIADFDVTGDFDLSTLEDAMDYVNSLRSDNGAQSNAIDYLYESNVNAAYNVESSLSSLEDLDIAEAVSEMKKEELLQTYQLQMEKMMLDNEEEKAAQLNNSLTKM